jgi:hypothetical protein
MNDGIGTQNPWDCAALVDHNNVGQRRQQLAPPIVIFGGMWTNNDFMVWESLRQFRDHRLKRMKQYSQVGGQPQIVCFLFCRGDDVPLPQRMQNAFLAAKVVESRKVRVDENVPPVPPMQGISLLVEEGAILGT